MANAPHTRWLDGMALLASGLCLLHCVALPLIVAILPMAAKLVGMTEAVHFWLLVAAVPTSIYALLAGARRSRRISVLISGIAALMLLFTGWWLEEATHYGTILTVSGSVLLGFSHIANWRLR